MKGELTKRDVNLLWDLCDILKDTTEIMANEMNRKYNAAEKDPDKTVVKVLDEICNINTHIEDLLSWIDDHGCNAWPDEN